MPQARVIPRRSLTRIAAVRLPDELREKPAFTELSSHYAQKIFEQVGYPFDVRLCIMNFPSSHLISDAELFEDLDCTGQAELEYSRQVQLTITKQTRLDGFLLWLVLDLAPGQTLDILQGRYSWIPVYFPVFSPGIEVDAGDVIEMVCQSILSDNGVNPDYSVHGRCVRQNREPVTFAWTSSHHQPSYKQTDFYQRLFGEDTLVVREVEHRWQWLKGIREHMHTHLPEPMLPSSFVLLEHLPLLPNGKVDRRTLLLTQGPTENKTMVAPHTPIEKALAAIWSQLLGRELVDCNQSFFALGGHSLLATRLLFRIQETFQVELPLRAIFEASTLAAMAQMIDALRAGTTISTRLPQERAWYEDAVLDPTIGRKESPVPVISQPVSPSGIFLTGATGFLGVHLLYELLQKTLATIYCLVRANSLEQGRQKLYHQLAVQQLWNGTIDETRIVPVPGDLASPLFGLSMQQFSELAAQVEVIYHAGARVHLIASYADLMATNVLGTQEVLRLACIGTIKPVHYISTLDVLAPPSGEDDKMTDENVSLDEQRDHLVDGYSQSKWVAEKLVQQAHERAIPTCVYRPGRIGGHSSSGAWNPDDYLCRLIRGCIQLGHVPDIEDSLDVIPVDSISRAIVHLSHWAGEPGKIFHLFNPNPLTVSDLIEYGRSFGYRLERVVYEEWRELVRQLTQEMPEHVLAPVLPSLPEKRVSDKTNERGYTAAWLGMTNAQEGLADMEKAYPSINEQLMHTYLSWLVQSGFLPPPR
jgi:thioester reductase-like protein